MIPELMEDYDILHEVGVLRTLKLHVFYEKPIMMVFHDVELLSSLEALYRRLD